MAPPAAGFNEAGAFMPRKATGERLRQANRRMSFNEAGAFMPRKVRAANARADAARASMRPGLLCPEGAIAGGSNLAARALQ